MNIKKHFIYIFLCVNIVMLGSCGIKPAHVEPPKGAEHDTFPSTYPDISADPQVGLERKEF